MLTGAGEPAFFYNQAGGEDAEEVYHNLFAPGTNV